MLDFFENLGYFVKFDILRFPLEIPENFSADILSQKIKIIKLKDGGLIAESVNYPNLYASADNLEQLREAFYDTTLTYFDIPRYYAKRRMDDFRIMLDDGTVIRAQTQVDNHLAHA